MFPNPRDLFSLHGKRHAYFTAESRNDSFNLFASARYRFRCKPVSGNFHCCDNISSMLFLYKSVVLSITGYSRQYSMRTFQRLYAVCLLYNKSTNTRMRAVREKCISFPFFMLYARAKRLIYAATENSDWLENKSLRARVYEGVNYALAAQCFLSTWKAFNAA